MWLVTECVIFSRINEWIWLLWSFASTRNSQTHGGKRNLANCIWRIVLALLERGQSVYQRFRRRPHVHFSSCRFRVSTWTRANSRYFVHLFRTTSHPSRRKEDRYGNLRQSSCCAATVQKVGKHCLRGVHAFLESRQIESRIIVCSSIRATNTSKAFLAALLCFVRLLAPLFQSCCIYCM